MKTGDLVCWIYEPGVVLIYVGAFRDPSTSNQWFATVINADARIVQYWMNELELLHEASSV